MMTVSDLSVNDAWLLFCPLAFSLTRHVHAHPCREHYLDHKCEQLAKEAKEKMASGDKRGTYR